MREVSETGWTDFQLEKNRPGQKINGKNQTTY